MAYLNFSGGWNGHGWLPVLRRPEPATGKSRLSSVEEHLPRIDEPQPDPTSLATLFCMKQGNNCEW
jgi:hypothetical protein